MRRQSRFVTVFRSGFGWTAGRLLAPAVSSLRHHDLKCDLKTPSLCHACMAGPPGTSVAVDAALDAAHLHDAGRVEAVRATASEVVFAVDTAGRSPPA
jgi:hypothetical protein